MSAPGPSSTTPAWRQRLSARIHRVFGPSAPRPPGGGAAPAGGVPASDLWPETRRWLLRLNRTLRKSAHGVRTFLDQSAQLDRDDLCLG
jgi:hypothetical protein